MAAVVGVSVRFLRAHERPLIRWDRIGRSRIGGGKSVGSRSVRPGLECFWNQSYGREGRVDVESRRLAKKKYKIEDMDTGRFLRQFGIDPEDMLKGIAL